LTGFVVVVEVDPDMFKGSLFPKSDLTTGELAGGFLLKVTGGFLYLFLFCGVAR
jgi:hypothetical protein